MASTVNDHPDASSTTSLVIGAGGAGLRAAIECARAGCSTGVICKSLLGKAHTVMAEGGMAAALGNVGQARQLEGPLPRHDARRQVPQRLAHGGAARQGGARRACVELEEWGAVFDRTKTASSRQRNFGGHRYPRLAHVGDRTGLELIRTLQDHGVHQGIAVHMECTALDRCSKDGDRIAGVLAYWRETGRFVLFTAKAVILATGGCGQGAGASRRTPGSTPGDGYALAYEAGAELMDMEFTQFHPTGMVWPPSVRGTLVTEGVRGEGGILLNNDGERFMFKYIPEKFAARDGGHRRGGRGAGSPATRTRAARPSCSRATWSRARSHAEVKAGRGSPHGGVFLDIASRRPAEFIKKKLPSMYHQFKELAEVDITKEPMEVGPTLPLLHGRRAASTRTRR